MRMGWRNKRLVVNNDNESVFQPQWSPDGTLYFISDNCDFWNLYRWNIPRWKKAAGR
jgi:hypothetical protein